MAILWGGAQADSCGRSQGRGPRAGPWEEGQAAGCAAGAGERRVYGRGRPNACQGGRARAGRRAEPGWAGWRGAQGRAGAEVRPPPGAAGGQQGELGT